MSHRPKPVRDHYTESLAVNSENLEKQLVEKTVPAGETKAMLDAISRLYLSETEKIVAECEKDMMALERVPSPLRLFIDSIAQVLKTTNVSPAASVLLKKYCLHGKTGCSQKRSLLDAGVRICRGSRPICRRAGRL